MLDAIDPRMGSPLFAPAAAQIRETLIYLAAFVIILSIGVGIVIAVINYTDKHRGNHH